MARLRFTLFTRFFLKFVRSRLQPRRSARVSRFPGKTRFKSTRLSYCEIQSSRQSAGSALAFLVSERGRVNEDGPGRPPSGANPDPLGPLTSGCLPVWIRRSRCKYGCASSALTLSVSYKCLRITCVLNSSPLLSFFFSDTNSCHLDADSGSKSFFSCTRFIFVRLN